MAESTPTRKVTGLKITRKGHAWTASWKVPSEATNAKSKNRFTGLLMSWHLDFDGKKRDIVDRDVTGNEKATSNRQTFGEFKGNWKPWKGKALKRSAFYPYSGGKKLDSVEVRVAGFHDSKGNRGPAATARYALTTPKAPTVSLSYDDETQDVSWTIETDPGDGHAERHDTRWRVWLERDGMKDLVASAWAASTKTKITGKYDLNGAGVTWSEGKAVTVHVEAYARGLAGDSGTTKKTLKVVWPKRPSIKGVSKDKGGRVKVAVEVSSSTVSRVQLQRQRNVAPGEQPDGDGWADVDGSVDDGQCSALYDLSSDAASTRGLHTWYRVRATNRGFADYSASKRADALFAAAPSAENDRCGIVSATPGDTGTTARVVVGWTEDDANTGTEIAWSEDPDAWQSTNEPTTFRFSWRDAERQSSKWGATATIIVGPLTEGTTYTLRARRYLEGEDRTTYTAWSAPVTVRPVTRPASVTLEAPSFVARGEDIELSWTYEGGATQTEWHLHPAGRPKVAYAQGSDSLGYATITPARYGSASSVDVFVSVGTGGETTDSNTVSVGIADPPSCECCAPATLAAQPAVLEAYTDTPTARLLVTCSARGITVEGPDGDRDQLPGDTVWTGATSPVWATAAWGDTQLRARLADELAAAQAELAAAQGVAGAAPEDEGAQADLTSAQAALEAAQAALAAHPEDGTTLVATVALPTTAELVDGASYDVAVTAVDTATGITGATSRTDFSVAWAHQAPAPPDAIAVTADPDARSATIALAAPEGAAETDTYSVYRRIPGGHALVGSGLPLGAVVRDPLAPFGSGAELSYRVCLVTADGDREFADYVYEMPVDVLRVDFGGAYLELPYNLELPHSYEKGFQARRHLSGGVGGYHLAGVLHTGSFSSEWELPDVAQLDLATALANHAGPCFCRTPQGHAFTCGVDVGIDPSGEPGLERVSLSVSEYDLAREHMLAPSDVSEG